MALQYSDTDRKITVEFKDGCKYEYRFQSAGSMGECKDHSKNFHQTQHPDHAQTMKEYVSEPEILDPIHPCICDKPLQRYTSTNIEAHQYNCPQDSAAGLLCHKHFESRRDIGRSAMQWEVAECKDCQKARKDNEARIQRTETIDPNQEYGKHIVLTCKLHPDLRWSTKNISYIGARTLFFNGNVTHDHKENPTLVPESLLKDGVTGPVYMDTPCSLRREFYGDGISGTDLDCECDCSVANLIVYKKTDETK